MRQCCSKNAFVVVGHYCKSQAPSHIITLIPILELRGLKMTHVTGAEFVVSVVILPRPDKADWGFFANLLCRSNSETTVLKIVSPRTTIVTSSPIQKRGPFGRHRLITAALLMAAACILLAADNKSSGPASDKDVARAYHYPFGASPFLPSQAKTESAAFIDSAAFPTAAFCSRCHDEVHQQWRQSAHANSFRAPFYKKNVDLLIAQKGIEFSRHCEGCHNPIALFSGALTTGSSANRSFDEDGITCMVCHSIQQIQNTSGTGSYVMGTPAVMVKEDGTPIAGPVTFDDILAHPKLHSKAVIRDCYRT